MTNAIKSDFKIWKLSPQPTETIPYDIKKFAAGEVQVTLKPEGEITATHILVEAFIKCSEGIQALTQIRYILESTLPQSTRVDLRLNYLPYSRYDRPMTGQYDCASLEALCNQINNMNFNSVVIFDNHSDVGTALLKRCTNIPQEQCIEAMVQSGIFTMNKYDALVIPDAGANKKVSKVAKAFGINRTVLAEKTRDLQTNAITGTEVYGDVKGLRLLICDDIIDGGRTFIELAKILKERGAASVDLYTTFGIFSYGIDCVRADIENVFCLFVWKENIAGNEDQFVKYLNS